MNSAQKLAEDWRRQNPHRKGGVVVIFEDTVQGWCNELRNPEHWRSGCIAVNEEGEMWLTIGGNDQDGAEEWLGI